MVMQVPKLNLAQLQAEAARISSKKKSGGNKGKDLPPIRYFNFQVGSNRIRLLPPSLKNLVDGIAMMLYRHWKLPGEKDKEICISSTFPNCGAACPIDPVLTKYADEGMDTYTWNAGGKGVTNVLDRKEESKLAQMVEMPMSVYQWLLASIIEEGMETTFFDPKLGVDLIVVKTETVNEKGKKKTEYKPSWSPKGPSPICADAKRFKAILESCYEVAEIYKPLDPKTEWGKKTLSRLKATASNLDKRLADRAGDPRAEQTGFEEEVAEDEVLDEEDSAITRNSSDKPECFAHSHADKSVEYADVTGGYNPEEYRCIMCPESPACSSAVLKKFPTHYNDDGSEMVQIKAGAKKTPPPPLAKKAAKKAMPAKKAAKKKARK